MSEKGGYVSTTNACRVCAPLGACVAFKGVRGAVPLLHGSQGCATYMRRYLISHFREPMDVASSSLGEKEAVFGGGPSLKAGLSNVARKYAPELVGVATTCLTEVIGDDVGAILGEFSRETPDFAARVVRVSTPSFQGNHVQGFHAAVRSLTDQLVREGGEVLANRVNLFPGFVSPADLRHLREIVNGFGFDPVILPDYSETLDGPAKAEYEPLPSGGTPVERIEEMGRSAASLELGRALAGTGTAAELLASRFKVPAVSLGLPVGLRESDRFFEALSTLSGRSVPEEHKLERGRLVDAYVDGHKYLAGRRVAVFGDEDLVIGLASFLAETGVQPVLCATGAKGERFAAEIGAATEGLVFEPARAESGVDFDDIARMAEEAKPELLIGTSKGFGIARKLGIPLLRVGFPIHDRFGGQRILHVGYRGALALYDRVVNAILEIEQERSSVGYGYL
jgi:nitrogenase molybdenum-iron protein NifN